MCKKRVVAAFLLLLLAVLGSYTTLGEQHPATADEGPLSEVQTAVGLEVALPCDLMPGTMIADKVQLVIWYRQGNVKPIYTFDARGRSLHQAIPWADENVFKNKAHFYYDTNPPALRIKNIQTSDAGLYKCRVDFHKSPTRNWRINVTVLVPPTQLTILDHHGAAIRDQMAGPYLEGDSINLTCLSSGGVPPPRVSWWREHALVDDSFHVLPDGTVRNVLHLKNIARKDLLTVYTCQASNGHVVAALTKKVVLDMNLPPLSLLLQGLNHALIAGTRTHVTCTAVGARPAPQIIWTKSGQVLKGSTQSTSSDGNTTVSELMLIPVPEDNERQVVCSISLNPSITSQQLHEGDTTVLTALSNDNMGLYLKDSRVLNVTHAPIVSLRLGAPLDPNNLLKGSDVYLECDVKANPGITRVEWYHNDKQLHLSRGVIISNQTLVLQGISKISHGQYFCRATNIQGSVSSNEVYLDVKYPPVCKAESTTIRAALKQTINITCQVDSNPLDNLNYRWHFNNSLERLIELPATLSTAPATMPVRMYPDGAAAVAAVGHTSGGYYQRSKRKHGHAQKFLLGRHGRVAAATSVVGGGSSGSAWANIRFEDTDEPLSPTQYVDEYDDGEFIDNNEHDEQAEAGDEQVAYKDQGGPRAQMVYSNMIYKNHLDNRQQQQQSPHTHQQQQLSGHQQQGRMAGGGGGIAGAATGHDMLPHGNQLQLAERKRLTAALHKKQHHRPLAAATMTTQSPPAPPLNNVYNYHIDSYDSFGAISCVASNAMGHSEPCWYHIQPADFPNPVKNCTAYNATANSIQIQCIAGYDGGIPQHFHVQIKDELTNQILYNTSYKYAEFTVKRLPSDSVFVIRITAVNAQGPSKSAFRVRGRTLSAPLLRTASSTAVLVQLTPLLGALLGIVGTVVLIAICIVIFLRVRPKTTRRPNGDTTTTEADKGSAEPLSRNMGSHSSLEDKNPDVVPQETNSEDEFHLEEKAFDRLNIESQRILYTPPTRINTASPPPPSLSPTFGKQYGELSLTTNPAFSLYNTPQRAPAAQRPVYTAPPPLLSTRTPPNIYTRIPGRSYLPAYETRTSPTSPYGSTTTCTIPLLSGQSNGSLQTNSSTLGSSSGGGIGAGGGSLTSNASSGVHCNTLPHPGALQHHASAAAAAAAVASMTTNGIPTALTSSMTSGNISLAATQSLLTSPRAHNAAAAAVGALSLSSMGMGMGVGVGSTQMSTATTTASGAPLLNSSSALLGSGNYETVGS
ncbi:nephrin [Anastrepha ludens]|uniref:nephrin n=1 Tax=Anastrepha ludens TaxID=28586 RepID=UPI0023AE9277|nr:nephrin [Anastrepha ludens]